MLPVRLIPPTMVKTAPGKSIDSWVASSQSLHNTHCNVFASLPAGQQKAMQATTKKETRHPVFACWPLVPLLCLPLTLFLKLVCPCDDPDLESACTGYHGVQQLLSKIVGQQVPWAFAWRGEPRNCPAGSNHRVE
jgi:hypothetical protein